MLRRWSNSWTFTSTLILCLLDRFFLFFLSTFVLHLLRDSQRHHVSYKNTCLKKQDEKDVQHRDFISLQTPSNVSTSMLYAINVSKDSTMFSLEYRDTDVYLEQVAQDFLWQWQKVWWKMWSHLQHFFDSALVNALVNGDSAQCEWPPKTCLWSFRLFFHGISWCIVHDILRIEVSWG